MSAQETTTTDEGISIHETGTTVIVEILRSRVPDLLFSEASARLPDLLTWGTAELSYEDAVDNGGSLTLTFEADVDWEAEARTIYQDGQDIAAAEVKFDVLETAHEVAAKIEDDDARKQLQDAIMADLEQVDV